MLEVDREFEFFKDVQPVCIDWEDYYQMKDISEGNEGIVSKEEVFI